ncbi:MAG: SGNH/GDSL hydrolase family protein, partial [Oscillospiraceae bacterium]|nr:SGNH/GDSL hydrolase family protein [Oscillospiraceae bacterium]
MKPEYDWLDQISTESFRVFDFTEGKDLYGDRSISIIGDSITQGRIAPLHYDQSWVALFKKALSKKYGTHNMGYVSLLDRVGMEEGEAF